MQVTSPASDAKSASARIHAIGDDQEPEVFVSMSYAELTTLARCLRGLDTTAVAPADAQFAALARRIIEVFTENHLGAALQE